MKRTTENDIKLLFGRNLKRIRMSHRISKLVLAGAVDMTHNFINDIESGKKWVSATTVAKLAVVLNVEPYQFFIPETPINEIEKSFVANYIDNFSNGIQLMLTELKNRYIYGVKEEKK